MTTIEQRLQQQIENALREYMLAGRTAVMTALERGFAAASSTPAERTKPATTRVRDSSSAGKRRTASELAALSEQLYEVIAAHPGEGMIVLSARMGVSGTQLQRAVARLRDAERIRTVGVRQQMRYFPRVYLLNAAMVRPTNPSLPTASTRLHRFAHPPSSNCADAQASQHTTDETRRACADFADNRHDERRRCQGRETSASSPSATKHSTDGSDGPADLA